MALWTPLDLSAGKLLFYYDATINSSLTYATSTTISGWADQGPNGINLSQSTTAYFPQVQTGSEINGNQAVLMSASASTGGGQFLEAATSLPAASTISTLYCGTINANGTYGRIFSLAPSGGGEDYGNGFCVYQEPSAKQVTVAIAGNFGANVNISGYGTPFLLRTMIGSGSYEQVLNGTSAGVNSITYTALAANPKIAVGNDASSSTASYSVEALVGTIVGFTGTTTDDNQRLEGWAAWKFGLQTSSGGVLPTGHPYYSAAPQISGGGYTQTVSISSGSVVTPVKKAGKSAPVSSTSTVTTIKGVSHAVSLTSTAAVASLKSIYHTLSLTNASVVASLKNVAHSLAVTSEGAVGVVTRQALARTLSLASSSSVFVGKSATKLLSLASASSVSAAGIHAILVTVTIASSGAVSCVKIIGKLAALTSASAVSLSKRTGKSLGFSSAGALTIPKTIQKAVSLGSTAALNVIRGKAYLQVVTIASTAVLTIAKKASVVRSIASASTVSVGKTIFHGVVLASAGIPTWTKAIGKTVGLSSVSSGVTAVGRFAVVLISLSSSSVVAIGKRVGTTVLFSSVASVVTTVAASSAQVAIASLRVLVRFSGIGVTASTSSINVDTESLK